MNAIVPSDSAEKWKLLLHLQEQKIIHSPKISRIAANDTGDDPFDCQDLIVPVLTAAINRVLNDKVAEWESLDSRILQHDGGTSNSLDHEDDWSDDEPVITHAQPKGSGAHHRKRKSVTNHTMDLDHHHDDHDDDKDGDIFLKDTVEGSDLGGSGWGWHAIRGIRLPDGFDYACRQTSPPATSPLIHPHPTRKQVLNLQDPLGPPLDYESELWRLFHSTPVQDDIEKRIMEGCLCINTLDVKQEIEQGLRDYTRIDAHSLGRLRKKKRHAWPTGGGVRNPPPTQINSSTSNIHKSIGGVNIRVECWRKLLKRGSSTDADRLEMEFCGEQTLLDLHNAIVYCANDQLFIKGLNDHHSQGTDESNLSPQSSGLFFIENTFYTTGEVDYCTPLINWLENRTPNNQHEGQSVNQAESTENIVRSNKSENSKLSSRYEYLGISADKIAKKRMKDCRLDSISFRLGVRYFYMFHGDCEISVFFTDVRLRLNNEHLQLRHYPLFHDVWTPSGPLMFCDGCEKAPAVVVTIEDELTDGGPTLLCVGCHHKIHYARDGSNLLYNNFRVFPLNIIQFHKDFCATRRLAIE